MRVELDQNLQDFLASLGNIDESIDNATELIAPQLQADLQENSGDSGRFKTGWGAEPLEGAESGILVTNSFPMAAYVEYPTRPHIIFPTRPGGVLSWMPRAGGFRVFAKWVIHPGFKGRDVFDTTMAQDQVMISDTIFAAIQAHMMGG